MIEAVNSVVANVSAIRGIAEQASAARSYAANPERAQEVIQAPYVSPYISIDVNHNKAVLQIRDGDTGDVLKQFPSEVALEILSRQIARQTVPAFDLPGADVEQGTGVQGESSFGSDTVAPQIAAQAFASTAENAQTASTPPTTGNVVVTA